MDISYQFATLPELRERYAMAPAIIAREQRVAMSRAVLFIEHDAKALAPWDTGHLRRSITHRLETAAFTVTGIVGTNVPYAAAVEDGRRAGAPMPPSGVLLGWMRRHGIEESSEYVLRRAIATKGIKPKPFLRPAYEKNRAQIYKELSSSCTARIIAALKVGI